MGAGFKGAMPGLSSRGLHKTEKESTGFTEASASLKSQEVICIDTYHRESG
jgi:hypothetical protein